MGRRFQSNSGLTPALDVHALQRVADRSQVDVERVRSRLNELQFFLPDLVPMAVSQAAARERWGEVTARLELLHERKGLEAAEVEVLDLVACAVR